MNPATSQSPSPLVKQRGLPAVLLSFLLGLAVSAAIFIPFLIVDKGFFIYCGDFNSQQIPFYYYVQGFLREGGGTWSWATDIGSSVVNSYSFYNLGSPFLWLTLLLPSAFLPYMMVPMLVLKFGCIAAAGCLFLSRYAKSRNMLVLCSVIYAFCGFNVYNVFFNHMLEPVIFFPLMLWALDGYMHEGRRGWFALFIGFALINSYFFFIGNVIFILIYFFVKLAAGEYRIDAKNFWLLVLEAVLGVGIGMVLALPAFFNMLGNPRVDNFTNGFGFVMYGKVQQYFAIVASMFLPPDPPYMPNIFTEGAIKWTSMSFFLPIVGMSGVFAYFKARKGGAVKWILGISLVMAMVPILNSSFIAFNASYYARWYYMPILIAVLATLHAFEDADIDLRWGVRLTLVLTASYVIYGLLPKKDDEGNWSIGVVDEQSKFWLTLLTALFAVGICYVLVRHWRGTKRFGAMMLAAVMGFSVLYSVIHISLGKFAQWERDAGYRQQQYVSARSLTLQEDETEFFRIDAFESTYDNLGLWMDLSCLQTFNSVVTPSIMEFYPMVGVKRDVSSKPETKHYALRGLLSVKYTLMPNDKTDTFEADTGSEGWSFYMTDGTLAVYQNENFVPLGFTYDKYVTMDNLKAIREDDRAPMLMRAIGLDEEQAARYGYLFEGEAIHWEAAQVENSELDSGSEGTTGWHRYDTVDYTHYVNDAADRRAAASYHTEYDASGFTCRIDMPDEDLVFFGVPYDDGFSATVNGAPAEVLKVSGGMMAVHAPAGDNEIVFSYQTPGLSAGWKITLLSLAGLGLYLVLAVWFSNRGERRKVR